ncbi:MAG: hypothetical protein D6813_09570 [Calditrichaeota bacterium]|nr:MAG: hypothetical protein D6813_09570 [Calditrichota bacterium]
MKLVKWITICVLIGFNNFVTADGGGQALQQISPDALTQALGNANQAYSVGASDLFVNPALLATHTKRSIQFSNINAIDWDIMQFVSFSIGFPLGAYGTLGVGAVGVNVPDIKEYTSTGQFLGNFSNFQSLFYLGFAKKFSLVSLGLNLKYYYSGFRGNTFEDNGSGWGMELGLYYIAHSNFKIGFNFQNSYQVQWGNNYQEEVPKRMQIGFRWSPPPFHTDFIELLFGFEQIQEEPIRLRSGIILTPIKNALGLHKFQLYGGIGNLPLEQRNTRLNISDYRDGEQILSAGGSIEISLSSSILVQLSYSYSYRYILNNQHNISTYIWF